MRETQVVMSPNVSFRQIYNGVIWLIGNRATHFDQVD